MSKALIAGVVVAAASASVSAFTPVNNAVGSRASLGVGSTLVPLDMSGLGYLNGFLTTPSSYEQTFLGSGGNYSGRLKVEVFANQSLPGPGLNDLLMVYSFRGDGAPAIRANGAEDFEFGVDTSVQVDYTDLVAATHGKITGESYFDGAQLDPHVTVNDFISSNDTFKFNFNPASGSGRLVELGGNTASAPGNTEDFVWYVRTTGNVAINFVDVRIADFGFVTIRSLAFVNNPGQPDINIPAPGVAAVLGLGALAAGRRRR
jgi:hypothetical protein